MRQLRLIGERRVFDSRWLARRPHVIALGDSHVSVVGAAARRPELAIKVSTCTVPGATALGLRRPDSRTNALEIFELRLARARPWQPLVFQLGEVDCGFVIWYRATKYGMTVDAQMQQILNAYSGLLTRQVACGHRTIVLSAPLPTIRDGTPPGEIANARREVTASQLERTRVTLDYNRRLSDVCRDVGATFLDATTATLDPSTGVLAHQYRNASPGNHHLDPQRYADIVAPLLRDALQR